MAAQLCNALHAGSLSKRSNLDGLKVRTPAAQGRHMLTTRPDGTLVKDLSPTRRLLPLMLRTRTESTVSFEQTFDVTETLEFLEDWNRRWPGQRLTLFHVYLWALGAVLHERPRLNRFVNDGEIYQRKGVFLSFAAKKRKMDDEAPLVTIKREMRSGMSLLDVAHTIEGDVARGRAAAPRKEDGSLELARRMPTWALKAALAVMRWADRWNLLPASVMADDPLYTSVFVANLGSLGLDAAFHHLFEWGNCPFFAALGQVKAVQTERGTRQLCTVRYTFDERIDDGLSCARSLELLRQRVEQPAKFEARTRELEVA